MRINCDFFRAHVMSQFDGMLEYLKHSEAQIQESHHTLRAEILSHEMPNGTTHDAVQEWLCLQQQERDNCDRRYAVEYRQILRFSVIMSTYTLVESNLTHVAKEIGKRKHLALDLEDLQAKDIVKRFEKFWTKVAGLSWWPDPRWDVLKDVEELRNCIAHRRGIMRGNDGRIKQLVDRGSEVSLVVMNAPLVDPDDAGKILVTEEICLRAIRDMAGLFTEIFEKAGCFGPDHIVVEP